MPEHVDASGFYRRKTQTHVTCIGTMMHPCRGYEDQWCEAKGRVNMSVPLQSLHYHSIESSHHTLELHASTEYWST